MIRTVRIVLTAFSLILLFAFGLDWLLEAAVFQGAIPHLDKWPGLRTLPYHVRFVFGAAGMLLPLGALSLLLAERGIRQGIKIETGAGTTVELRPEGIERLVNRQVRDNVQEVLGIASEARQGNNAAAIDIWIKVNDKRDVPAIQRDVLAVAERTLRDRTGNADPAAIRVVVQDVAPTGAPKRPAGGEPRKKRPAPKPTPIEAQE